MPPPLRSDGSLYRFEMIYGGGGWRAYADSGAELVAVLVPGYAELDDGGRQRARIGCAARAQVLAQAELTAAGDLAGCTDAQVRILLSSREVPPAPVSWSAPVPLVLVTSFYVPIGVLPRPVAEPPGQIVWLDPADEFSLLAGLHEVGMIDLAERSEPASGAG